jgi:hypothetical protein
MNDTLQTALAWFGALSALGYIAIAAWICVVSVIKGRDLEAERAAQRARRQQDAELAQLAKETGR